MSTPNNLVPFSIEEWKKRPLDVVTRGGQKAIIAGVSTAPVASPSYSVVGWIDGLIECWHPNGNWSIGGDDETVRDLFMLPEATVTYINIFPTCPGGIGYPSVEEAAKGADHSKAIAVCKFTIRGSEVITEIVHRYTND